MKTEIGKPASLDELPDFCTLEEVSKVFRVSRATAYAGQVRTRPQRSQAGQCREAEQCLQRGPGHLPATGAVTIASAEKHNLKNKHRISITEKSLRTFSKEKPLISYEISGFLGCHYEITIFGKRCGTTVLGYPMPRFSKIVLGIAQIIRLVLHHYGHLSTSQQNKLSLY